MSSYYGVIELVVTEKRARGAEFKPNNNRQARANEGRPKTKNKIKRANIFVICG